MTGPAAREGETLIAAGDEIWIAQRPGGITPRGVRRPESVRVLNHQGQQIGTWLSWPHLTVSIHWRTARGDHLEPRDLDTLLARCARARKPR